MGCQIPKDSQIHVIREILETTQIVYWVWTEGHRRGINTSDTNTLFPKCVEPNTIWWCHLRNHFQQPVALKLRKQRHSIFLKKRTPICRFDERQATGYRVFELAPSPIWNELQDTRKWRVGADALTHILEQCTGEWECHVKSSPSPWTL